MRHRPRFRLHHLAPLADNVPRTLATMLMMETPLLVLPVTAMPVSKMQTPMVMMVPMMDTGADHRTTRLGEPLRGRAFRSNLRFAPISTAIPLASVRFAHCALRLPENRARRADMPDTAPDIRFVLLAPALRASLVAGFAPVHSVPRRCRLRRAPGCAPPAAPLAPLVRALLRCAPALRSAPRRAPVPAPVRSPPPPPSAACFARLPAAPSAPTATHSPWRLQSAGFPGVDSPFAHTAGSAVLTARGGLGFHTRRIGDALPASVGHRMRGKKSP